MEHFVYFAFISWIIWIGRNCFRLVFIWVWIFAFALFFLTVGCTLFNIRITTTTYI